MTVTLTVLNFALSIIPTSYFRDEEWGRYVSSYSFLVPVPNKYELISIIFVVFKFYVVVPIFV